MFIPPFFVLLALGPRIRGCVSGECGARNQQSVPPHSDQLLAGGQEARLLHQVVMQLVGIGDPFGEISA